MGWTTDNEMRYIDSLVREEFTSGKVPVEQILRNYIKGARRRTLWGTFGQVEGHKVIAYAKAALDRLEGR